MADVAALLRTRSYAFALALAVALLVANVAVAPSFADPDSVPATLAALAPFAIVAMASTPAIISGGIDLSIGPLLSFANVMMVAVLLPAGLGDPWLAIPIVVGLGAAVGAANGVLVAVLRFPPVIATLGALFVLGGINQKIASTPEAAPDNWTNDLTGMVGPVPGAVLVLAVPVLVWLALRRGAFHRTLFAVGGGDVAAFSAGVDVRAARVAAYALGGAFAAVGGLALTGFIRSGDAGLGLQYTLIALAAVALGGTPLGGGRGGLVGPLFGASCIFLLQNLLSELNVSSLWLQVAYGGVLILAVVLGSTLTATRRPQVAT